MTPDRITTARPHAQSGFSVIEVMVALLIGIFLLSGALTIYASSRSAVELSGQMSRMLDNSRFALDLIEPDLRSAGFWGLTNATEFVGGRASPADPAAYVVTNDCDTNWAVDLDNPVAGSDNANPFSATCLSGDSDYLANTDVLVLRHAADTAVATANLQAGHFYIRADESHAEIFIGTVEPNGFAAAAQNFELITHAYFIAPGSDLDADVPSLRRLELDDNGVNPVVNNVEVLSGAEDFQVQYGLDTDNDGSVNSYVDADPALDFSRVLSVRLWLRMRNNVEDERFSDTATYTYADKSFSPATTVDTSDDHIRRLLVSKTISLRNRLVVLNNG